MLLHLFNVASAGLSSPTSGVRDILNITQFLGHVNSSPISYLIKGKSPKITQIF